MRRTLIALWLIAFGASVFASQALAAVTINERVTEHRWCNRGAPNRCLTSRVW